ncbi:MAG: NADH-quinone oxidoreductase subunit J [Candidatus Omnitrophota bacterium]
MRLLLFYFFSFVAVAGGFGVILNSRPMRSLLSLLATMASLAGIFILQHAYFIAMIHLIVYAGAVLVLFLFVIMMQGLGAVEPPFARSFTAAHRTAALIVIFGFLGALTAAFFFMPASITAIVAGSAKAIGKSLFTDYLLPFELTSILLLLGVFAGVSLARKEDL